MNLSDDRVKRIVLERHLLEALSRMLAHDINGKVMGVDGILSCWETLGVEPENFQEDISIVRDSFRGVKAEFMLLNWFFQSEPKFEQAIAMSYFIEITGRYLARFFRAPLSFTLQPVPDGHSVFCTPHQLVFWTSSFCRMMSLCRPGEEPVCLQIAAGSDGTRLDLHCRSEFLLHALENNTPPTESLSVWQEWFSLLHANEGFYTSNSDSQLPITVTIPLQTTWK